MTKPELKKLIKEVLSEDVRQQELQRKLVDYKNPQKLVKLETFGEGFITMTFTDTAGVLTTLSIEATGTNELGVKLS